MNKRKIVLAAALCVQAACSLAQGARPCDPAKAIGASAGNAAFLSAVGQSVSLPALSDASCASVIAVLRQLFSARFRAGSQLKTGQGPNDAKAAAEIAQLRADPQRAAELDAVAREPNALARAVIEAALYEQYGKYTARDVRLDDARKLGEGP